MPDVYEVPVPLSFHITGVLAVGTSVLRKIVPFDHEVVGAAVTLNTGPVGADAIFDILHGANGVTGGSLASIWPTNNGTSGNPDNRPRVKAGANDQAAIASTTTTVAPQGTDPALSGQSTGVSTTYTNYNESPFLAKADPSPAGAGFAGNQPVNESNQTSVLGTPGVPQAPANRGFIGKAGDAYVLSVVEVGSTTAGSDAELILWLLVR